MNVKLFCSLSVIIFFMLLGLACHRNAGGEMSLADVFSDRVPLIESEKQELEKLITKAQLEPSAFRVSSLANFNLFANGVAIENSRIVGLALNKMDVSSLQFLENWDELQKLSITNTGLQDLADLSRLQKLTYVYLNGNRVQNVLPLSALTNLETLDLSDNQLNNLHGLSSLANLKSLNLTKNQFADLKDLPDFPQLTHLDVGSNLLQSAEGWQRYPNLIWLSLRDNQLKQFEVQSNPSELEFLNLEHNQLSQILGLKNLKHLNTLYLDQNQLTDIPDLQELSALKTYSWNNNPLPQGFKMPDLVLATADATNKIFEWKGAHLKDIPENLCLNEKSHFAQMAKQSCSTDFAVVNDTHGQCEGSFAVLKGCVAIALPLKRSQGSGSIHDLIVEVGSGEMRVSLFNGTNNSLKPELVTASQKLTLNGSAQRVQDANKSYYYVVFETVTDDVKNVRYSLRY